MKSFKKNAIVEFVKKNYPGKTEKETKKIINYHTARIVGMKDDLIVILKENEGFIGISKKGNLVDI